MATATDVRALLAGTTLPPSLIDSLLEGASPMWLMGEAAQDIAGDLVLCHPTLSPEEVRASVLPTEDPHVWRLSVVAHDRSGLLARTAGALASHGLSVLRASVSSWPDLGLALQRVFATNEGDTCEWDRIGDELRAAIACEELSRPTFEPSPPVKVMASAHRSGRTLVRLSAPDKVGLLWAVAGWMADHGCNIEVARVGGDGTMADDTFVVDGVVDAAELASYLSGGEVGQDTNWLTWPLRLGGRAVDLLRRTIG